MTVIVAVSQYCVNEALGIKRSQCRVNRVKGEEVGGVGSGRLIKLNLNLGESQRGVTEGRY